RLPDAVTNARQSITHADQSGDAFLRMVNRTTAADSLYLSGHRVEAGTLFAEAERMQKGREPDFDLLDSLGGFRYCEWLLISSERSVWQTILRSTGPSPVRKAPEQDAHATEAGGSPVGIGRDRDPPPHGQDGHGKILAEVERRATMTFTWAT